MADPYQIFYDEEAKFSQPPSDQPYPTPATDLAISRAAKLKAAEQQYYNTKNSQPGFVSHNDPGAMDQGTFQGLLDALKPQPLGAGLPPSRGLEPQLQAQEQNRDAQRDTDQYAKDLSEMENDLTSSGDEHRMGPEDVYKTIGMNINGEEWEVPAAFDEMSDQDRAIIQGLPQNQWPKYLLDKIEENARNELEQGNDPFGNKLNQQLDDNGNPIPPQEHEDIPGYESEPIEVTP